MLPSGGIDTVAYVSFGKLLLFHHSNFQQFFTVICCMPVLLQLFLQKTTLPVIFRISRIFRNFFYSSYWYFLIHIETTKIIRSPSPKLYCNYRKANWDSYRKFINQYAIYFSLALLTVFKMIAQGLKTDIVSRWRMYRGPAIKEAV